jgi:hypothetical protein
VQLEERQGAGRVLRRQRIRLFRVFEREVGLFEAAGVKLGEVNQRERLLWGRLDRVLENLDRGRRVVALGELVATFSASSV